MRWSRPTPATRSEHCFASRTWPTVGRPGSGSSTEVLAPQPQADGIVIDLSRKAAEVLGFIQQGHARVRLEVLAWATADPYMRTESSPQGERDPQRSPRSATRAFAPRARMSPAASRARGRPISSSSCSRKATSTTPPNYSFTSARWPLEMGWRRRRPMVPPPWATGRALVQTDALLSFACIALLVVALVAFGWRSALLALALSFVYVAAANPLAKRLARNMLGYRTTCAGTGFEPDYSVEAMIQRSEKTDRRLAHIAAKPAIARVLAAHDLSGEDLEDNLDS